MGVGRPWTCSPPILGEPTPGREQRPNDEGLYARARWKDTVHTVPTNHFVAQASKISVHASAICMFANTVSGTADTAVFNQIK